MNYLIDLFSNKFFLAPACAWFIAQVLKILIDIIKGTYSWERLIGSGGMPSSHSATVTALLCITAALKGLGSFEFVVAFFFGAIVIYDSRGVRYETQRQGKALNNLNEERLEEKKQPLDIIKFKEKLGHTVPELIAGMVIGIICTVVVYYLPF